MVDSRAERRPIIGFQRTFSLRSTEELPFVFPFKVFELSIYLQRRVFKLLNSSKEGSI